MDDYHSLAPKLEVYYGIAKLRMCHIILTRVH
jgi:hypothetical protein